MRKQIFLFGCFLLSIQFILAQHIDTVMHQTPQSLHDFYMHKRKVNTIAGWIVVGSGIGMFVGGASINISSGWGEGNHQRGIWLCYLGGATTLASIPLFVMAGVNKRKAKLALKNETVLDRKIYGNFNYAALALTIEL